MKTAKRTSTILVICLAAIALIVFLGQVSHTNMWLWICAYWCVLTLKNICDILANNKKSKTHKKAGETKNGKRNRN